MASAHILNSHPELFYLVSDDDGKILRQSKSFKEFVSHIKPLNFRDIVTVDADWDEVYDALVDSKKRPAEHVSFSCQTKGKTGRLRYVKWHVYYVVSSYHFTGMQILEDVPASAIELQKKNEQIESILHAIHHDLRQPMRSLSGLISLRHDLMKVGDSQEDLIETERLIVEATKKVDDAFQEILIRVERRIS